MEANKDIQQLLTAMGRLRDGDFGKLNTIDFENPLLARAYNDMVKGVTERNNQFLVRINDAMTRIADNGNVKELLEQIELQQDAIKTLLAAKKELSFSMKKVEDASYEMLALSRQIRNSYEPYTQDLTKNYEEVQDSIEMTKSIMEDIRHLGESTYSDEERVAYLEEFVATMETFVAGVEEQRSSIQEAVENLKALNGRIEAVIGDILLINATVEKQNMSSANFLKGVDSIAESYEDLSIGVFKTGGQLYRISRDVDNARNDMFRRNSKPTIHDTLRIYEVDHYTLTWRVYNHIMELETLKLTQLNNPDRCKFGLWCDGVEEDFVLGSKAFRDAFDAHAMIHKHAVAAFMAKEDYDMNLAKKEFSMTMDAFERFRLGLDELHVLYVKSGIPDETPLWKFK